MRKRSEGDEMGMGITVRFVLEHLIPSWFNSVILKQVISIAVAAAEKEVLSENHSTHTDAPSPSIFCDDTRYLEIKTQMEVHFSLSANMGAVQSNPK